MKSLLLNLPVRAKLIAIALLSCSIALLLAAAVRGGFQYYSLRETFSHDLAALSKVIASNTTAAVTFQDAKSASEVLQALEAKASVLSASLWLPDGTVLSRFGADDDLGGIKPATDRPATHFPGLAFRHLQPVILDGEQIATLYVRADFGPTLQQASKVESATFGIAFVASLLLAFLVSSHLQSTISGPVLKLAETAATIAKDKDYSLRAQKFGCDEVGALTDAFNRMLAEIQGHDAALRREIAERARVEQEVDKLHKQVLQATRQAGMAEVATGVLHNVGNVLNSVNISTALLNEQLEKSRASNVSRIAQLLHSRAGDLGEFLTTDPKGRALPDYLAELGQRLEADRLKMHAELRSLAANIEHIKEIVAMQQNYAKVSGETESLPVTDLVEDSLRMNAAAFVRHGVTLRRDFAPVPFVSVDKHKVLQILTNLLRNAKYAVDEITQAKKLITVRTRVESGGFVAIIVADNGVGIPAENLTRIFAYGFTTRKEGHGFGLHSGALAAKEMGGALTVTSEGPGRGATFTLTVPIAYDLRVSPATSVCPPKSHPLTAAS